MSRLSVVVTASLFVLAGCGDDAPPPEDGGARDAGALADASSMDATVADVGSSDLGGAEIMVSIPPVVSVGRADSVAGGR